MKHNVYNRTHNLYDFSFIHDLSHFLRTIAAFCRLFDILIFPRYQPRLFLLHFYFRCALAPLHTSVISCVIAACLALLYMIDKSWIRLFALSVADFIAIMRRYVRLHMLPQALRRRFRSHNSE